MPPSDETSSYTLQETAEKIVPSLSIITCDKERHAFLRHLAQLYGIPRIRNFPGGHPTSVRRSDVARMQNERCMIALKTDGVRYLLLLCTLNNAFRAIMVDRCLRMYEVAVFAREEYFTHPTLIDGELVLDHRANRLSYQAFDVVSMLGQCYHHKAYCDRLQTLHNRILSRLPEGVDERTDAAEDLILEEDKIYAAESNHMRLTIIPKRFVPFDQGRILWEQRHAQSFPSDGMVITFDHSPITTGTLHSILKWKPHNVIDVSIVHGKTMSVECRDAGETVALQRMKLHDVHYRVALEDNNLVQWLLHRKSHLAHWLVECLVTLDAEKAVATLWPMRERVDKIEANDIRVIEATLSTISDNVKLEDLFAPRTLCEHTAVHTVRTTNAAHAAPHPGPGKATQPRPGRTTSQDQGSTSSRSKRTVSSRTVSSRPEPPRTRSRKK